MISNFYDYLTKPHYTLKRVKEEFSMKGQLERIIFFVALISGCTHTFANETVKLEPQMRVLPNNSTEQIVSMDAIRPFLGRSIVLNSKKQFEEAPYILAEERGNLEAGRGSMVFVKGLKESEETNFDIFDKGRVYFHPITKEELGFEADAVGSGEIESYAELSRFKVLTSEGTGIPLGSKLFPHFASALPKILDLRPAQAVIEEGFILSVRHGVDQIGQNQVILISLGEREGLAPGNTLDIYQAGVKARDIGEKGWRIKMVQLPDKKIGRLLIFKTYEKLSMGLVLEATEVIHLLDKVKCP